MDIYKKIPEFSRLNEVSLDISNIECNCYTMDLPKSDALLGVIKFSGKYGHGSGGSDDALFIDWRINEFCDLDVPLKISALIVDFSELEYEWGDDLFVYPERLRSEKLPVQIVVNEKCYEAYQGILGEKELKTDRLEALDEIKVLLKR